MALLVDKSENFCPCDEFDLGHNVQLKNIIPKEFFQNGTILNDKKS